MTNLGFSKIELDASIGKTYKSKTGYDVHETIDEIKQLVNKGILTSSFKGLVFKLRNGILFLSL